MYALTIYVPKEPWNKNKKGSSRLLHNTPVQSLNSRPKLAISSLALADLAGNSVINYEINVDSKVLLDK